MPEILPVLMLFEVDWAFVALAVLVDVEVEVEVFTLFVLAADFAEVAVVDFEEEVDFAEVAVVDAAVAVVFAVAALSAVAEAETADVWLTATVLAAVVLADEA